jgi:hypothetical protein
MWILESAIEFRKRHFSIFASSIFLGIFSSVSASALAITSYFVTADTDLGLKIAFAGLMVTTLIQTISGFNILCGRPRYVFGIALLFYFHLLVSVFAIAYDPPPGLYFLALTTSLAGLFCVNSKRYRAMLRAAEKIRLEKSVEPQRQTQPKPKRSKKKTAMAEQLRIRSDSAADGSDRSITIMIVICWGLSLFFVFVIGMKLYFVCDGVFNGVVVAANRYGPPKSYSFTTEPWMYGLSMFLHLLTVAVSALFLRLMLLLRSE